jgi:phosphatidylglycerophosphate synthase
MYTIRDLRKYQYDYHKENFPFAFNFIKNPYSFLKARFYMESSAVFVWFLLKTNIKPNTVTIIYGIAGIITGILLSIPNYYTVIIALFIAFTKGILDWSDGHLARITGQTSLTGYILDGYGAILNSYGFQIGLGLYVANRTDSLIFYYLVILLVFVKAAGLIQYSRNILLKEISTTKVMSNFIANYSPHKKGAITIRISRLRYIYDRYFVGFLDDRSRSVDFICLIILLELHFSINISHIIFILLLAKYIIIFVGSFYLVSKGGWIEHQMNKKLGELYSQFVSDSTIKK